jgi:hypothetical protein
VVAHKGVEKGALAGIVSSHEGQVRLRPDANGNLFGVTRTSSPNGVGFAWELAKGASSITTLASFPASVTPIGVVVFDSKATCTARHRAAAPTARARSGR